MQNTFEFNQIQLQQIVVFSILSNSFTRDSKVLAGRL